MHVLRRRHRLAGERCCTTADPELFFPISSVGVTARQARKAQQVCGRCQVRQECLDFAVRAGEMNGIWGGILPEDRIRMRREETARRRAEARRRDFETPDLRAS